MIIDRLNCDFKVTKGQMIANLQGNTVELLDNSKGIDDVANFYFKHRLDDQRLSATVVTKWSGIVSSYPKLEKVAFNSEQGVHILIELASTPILLELID